MTPLTGRQQAMLKLMEVCKESKVADIFRAVLFLQRAKAVRSGCREDRNKSRESQATASKRKAAKQDNPLTW